MNKTITKKEALEALEAIEVTYGLESTTLRIFIEQKEPVKPFNSRDRKREKLIKFEEIKEVWKEIRDEADPFTADSVLEKMDLFIHEQEEESKYVKIIQQIADNRLKAHNNMEQAYLKETNLRRLYKNLAHWLEQLEKSHGGTNGEERARIEVSKYKKLIWEAENGKSNNA